MASAQEAGIVQIWAKAADGRQTKVLDAHVSSTAPQGGAADGALSSVLSPDELNHYSPQGPRVTRDGFFEVVFIAEGADGVDVSDCIWNIPVTEYDENGNAIGTKVLSRAQFNDFTQADFTTVADMPMVFGRYKVTEKGLRFGGGALYLDVQDDTA